VTTTSLSSERISVAARRVRAVHSAGAATVNPAWPLATVRHPGGGRTAASVGSSAGSGASSPSSPAPQPAASSSSAIVARLRTAPSSRSGYARAQMADMRNLNRHPRLLRVARLARQILPGDSRFGDPLSTAGGRSADVAGRHLTELAEQQPTVLREAGLSALQVWQSLSETQGRGRGERDLAIVFTDLVGFSDWALRAGDEQALELLRGVAKAIEPPVKDHGGEIVKRLGDGMMAVFEDPGEAVAAIHEARERLAGLQVDGYDPQIRAGMHIGRPRRIGGDYLGVDVNIAARMAESASGGELLVSDRTAEQLDQDSLELRRKRGFKLKGVKGVPSDMQTYSVAIR
jgi:adenylate cyclase